METTLTVVNFTRAITRMGKLFIFGIVLFTLNGTCDGYDMENYCGKEFEFLLKSKYQIKLQLDDTYLYDRTDELQRQRIGFCEAKFEAWFTLYSKIMFYFEDLDLDCEKGHLEFYMDEIGYNRVPGLDKDICGYGKPHGVFTVEVRYLRIRYVPKSSQFMKDIFSIIMTIYRVDDCPNYVHECANSRCILKELACNGYDSCGDGSGCDLSTSEIVGIVIGSVIGFALIVGIVTCCICCRTRKGSGGIVESTDNSTTNPPMHGVNQGQPFNSNQYSYPLATTPSIPPTAPNQQGNSHPMNDVNHGTHYTYTNQQPPDQKQFIAPPPTYTELFPDDKNDTDELKSFA